MNKYIDVDEQKALSTTKEERSLAEHIIYDYEDLVNKDLYTFLLNAYASLCWSGESGENAFEFLKFILKKAGLHWGPYDISVGDTVEIVDPDHCYNSYTAFFDEYNLEEYKDTFIETQKEYQYKYQKK